MREKKRERKEDGKVWKIDNEREKEWEEDRKRKEREAI